MVFRFFSLYDGRAECSCLVAATKHEHVHVSQFLYSLLHIVCVVSHTLKGNCSVRCRDRCRMCSAMPSSSVTSTVMIPTWDVLHPTACSQPARWARANHALHTSLLWYMKCTTTYNLIFWLAAQPQSHSQPVRRLSVFAAAAAPRGCVAASTWHWGRALWHWVTGGILSSLFVTTSHRRRVVCHPVPIDSTRGCGSAVLFLGLSHPRLLPRPICVTPARRRQIWLRFPDGISSDIMFGIPRSSQAGPFFLLLLLLLLLLLGARCVESLPSAPCTLMERGPLIMS